MTRRRTDRAPCRILRIETSTETPPRKRYVCACGKFGPWDRDAWRNGHVRSAEALVRWNWRVHAGNIAAWAEEKQRQNGLTESIAVRLSPDHIQRLNAAAQGTGRTLQDFIRDSLLQALNSASVPADIKPCAVVEWEPEYAHGMMRGTVTRVEHGRVFLTIERKSSGRRRKPVETWFEPDEVHRLRVVDPGATSP